MDPRFEFVVEELGPFFVGVSRNYVEYQTPAEEKMFVAEGGRHAAVVEQIFVGAMSREADLARWFGALKKIELLARLVKEK